MDKPNNITFRDPADLAGHFHPSLKHIPPLDPASPEFKAIQAGVGQCGIVQPLIVDEHGRILTDHSRTLLACARLWALERVPVQVRDAAEAPLLLIHDLAHRRQLTKSAIAYLAYPLLKPAWEGAREKMEKGQFGAKKADFTGVHSMHSRNIEEFAIELGISRRLLFEAKEVHELFDKDNESYPFEREGGATDGAQETLTLREYFEPKIFRAPIGGEHEQNRPMGLNGVLSGIKFLFKKSKSHRGGRPEEEERQLKLFSKILDDELNRWRYWAEFDESVQQMHWEKVRVKLKTMDPDDCENLAKYHDKMAKECREGVKRARAEGAQYLVNRQPSVSNQPTLSTDTHQTT
jgi:hypothetical protein